MINLKEFEIWFVTGSQHLYGEETLKQVAEHSQSIAAFLNDAPQIPVRVVFKPTVKSAEEIYAIPRRSAPLAGQKISPPRAPKSPPVALLPDTLPSCPPP